MIDEWCKEAPKELDFNHEAGSLALMSTGYFLLNEIFIWAMDVCILLL